VPVALQDEMIARLPNPVDVVTIEAGHLPPVTHPEWFADVVATVGRVAQD
jgi:pimeloyl-ACP methyl ester carboxylesterase